VDEARRSGAIVHTAEAPGLVAPRALRPAYAARADELVQRPVARWHQILSQWRHFPDHQRSWIPDATRVARDLHAQLSFDVAWSTSPPESAHYVGRALAEAGVPWVADFRDQWSDYLLARWDPLSRRVIDHITRRILADAAAVTANTEGVAASIRRASGRDVRCIRNGHDPLERTDRPVCPRTLGYFGRIDPELQHPERLWPALRRLRDEGEPWRVELYLTPGGGGGAAVAVPRDLEGYVAVLPPLPYHEALERMQEMSVNLVLAWETRGGETSVAGKLFEYVGSGRPVLVLAPHGFEARTLVEATRTGVGAWGDEELVAALRALTSFVPDAEGRASLSRAHTAAELLQVLRTAAAGPRRGGA
jgi:hypothetical protein